MSQQKKKKEIDAGGEYVRLFILEKGANDDDKAPHTIVSKKTGISAANLKHVVDGDNRAGIDTISALCKHYKDFDLYMAVNGEPGMPLEIAAVMPEQTAPLQPAVQMIESEKINHKDEIISLLKRQVESVEKDKEYLMRDNERLFQIAHPQLFTDHEGVKMLSSSHTTAGDNFDIFGSVGVSQDRTSERDAMRVKGFEVGQASASENEVKIVKMPVDYFTHVKVNRLNSLAPMVKKTA